MKVSRNGRSRVMLCMCLVPQAFKMSVASYKKKYYTDFK